MSHTSDYRVAIIGAGFGGLGMATRLTKAGIDDFVVLEKAGDIGGTWRENTYPGCRCDVPSHLYSYSFAPNPNWSSTFSGQREIWDYMRQVATDHGVLPHVRFDHRVLGADWDDSAGRWRIETDKGQFTAQCVVAAPGPLHEPSVPSLPGIERFEGTAFHSAQWDHDYDLDGKSVAVIGTGASAIQFVPQIQPKVGKLHLFQRTAPWVLPRPDRPLTRVERLVYRAFPPAQRAMRQFVYWVRESFLIGFAKEPRIMRVVEQVGKAMLRRQVPDPELRRKLTPQFRLGCKRVLIADDYYPALTRPNVDVVASGVRDVRAHSIVDGDGTERPVDAIIYGTGFHVTDMQVGQMIRGVGGRSLDELWQGSPQAYLGTTVPGFPNAFLLAGPNTGIGHTSLVYLLECQIAYVFDCLRQMVAYGLDTVDVRPDVWTAYNEELQRKSQGTVWLSGCASWYIDRNGLNTTLFPDFTFNFRRRTKHFDLGDYEFTRRDRSPAGTPAQTAAAAAAPAARAAPWFGAQEHDLYLALGARQPSSERRWRPARVSPGRSVGRPRPSAPGSAVPDPRR
jgi:cation diffusion facilitator CzcD-associated flavoprotein CzcO